MNMQLFKSAIRDCLLSSVILIIYHPFRLVGDRGAIILTVLGIIFISFVVSLITSCVVRRMISSEEPNYAIEVKRLLWQYILNTLILAVVLSFYIAWQMRGDVFGMWDLDHPIAYPLFTLIPGVAFVYLPLFIWNRIQLKNRFLNAEIEELQSLNALLESEHGMLRSRLSEDDTTDRIILHGDSRESLIINPLDILYVESIGNYLNILYFSDSELCQRRLRSPLKEVEETLESFPFMVHIHRAFLVNINFITQVSGNSAGYKISLFSTDRVLPVSKANVALFRDKIQELGKDLK